MYKVEYEDDHKVSMAANTKVSNLFAKVHQYRQRFLFFDKIIDWRTYGSQIKLEDAFIHISIGNKRRRETTKYWEFCIQWKDGTSTWNTVKGIK